MIRCLSAGESRAKSVVCSAASASSASDMASTCAPKQHVLGRQAHFLADLAADQFVVAGEDFHRDAVVAARPAWPARPFPWADRETPRSP